MTTPEPLDKGELLELGDRHDVVLWQRVQDTTVAVRVTSVQYVDGRWVDFGMLEPTERYFYAIADLPKILMAWILEADDDLKRDRKIYGYSFEIDGRRVDPTRVCLHNDGTYTIAGQNGDAWSFTCCNERQTAPRLQAGSLCRHCETVYRRPKTFAGVPGYTEPKDKAP